MEKNQLTSTWWTLKVTLGLVTFLAGLDKFFNVLATWTDYLNPAVFDVVNYRPMTPQLFMQGVGIVEMIVGFAILSAWTRVGSYLASLWLVAIAVSLFAMGRYYDVAVRDLVLSVTAFTLARLSEVRHLERVTAAVPEPVVTDGGFLSLNLSSRH